MQNITILRGGETLCVVKQRWLHLKSEQPDTGLL